METVTTGWVQRMGGRGRDELAQHAFDDGLGLRRTET
jgi:hypothetical protein